MAVISILAKSGSILVRWAVMGVLKTRHNSDEKVSIIRALVCDSQSIGLAAEWINDVTDPKEESSYPKIEGAVLDEMKTCWLKKVRAAARDGRLLKVAYLNWVLSFWMQWADASEAKEWVASLLANPKGLLKFLKAYTNEAQSQTIGSYYARDEGWLSWKSSLEMYFPRNKWERIANELPKIPDLSDDEKRTLRLFEAAMKRWQSGVEDDNPRKFEHVELEGQ
jgi:hypothetical protein